MIAQDIGGGRYYPAGWDGPSSATVAVLVSDGSTEFGRVYESLSTTRDRFHDSFSRSGSFSFVVDNFGDSSKRDTLISVAAWATAFAPHVPEPSSWSLMLGGLALVGAVLRLRRSGDAT